MKRYELEARNKAELIEHAEIAGIKLAADDTKGTMIDRILGEKAGADDPEESPAPLIKKQADKLPPPQGRLYTLQGERVTGRRMKLTISSVPGGDNSPVPIVVNGHNIVVKRGVEVEVDEAYVNVLRDSVCNTVVQDPDTGIMMAQQVTNFPFSAVPA